MHLFNQSNNNISLGKKGELVAIKYLKKSGYGILEKNFKNSTGRCLGEIDIIAKEKDTFVFVEVKTRIFSEKFTILPEENITRDKLYKLNKIISFYIKKHNLWEAPYRIDAISVIFNEKTKKNQIKHLQNIFF